MVTIEWYCSNSTPFVLVTCARRVNALCWSGSCMMPKQSSTVCARDDAVAKPRSGSRGIHVPPWGLPNSRTVSPRSQPAAATRSIAVRCLDLQRVRLHTAGLVGNCVVIGELRQAAYATHLHHQRVRCLLRADGIGNDWKVVGRRYLPKIKNRG